MADTCTWWRCGAQATGVATVRNAEGDPHEIGTVVEQREMCSPHGTAYAAMAGSGLDRTFT